MSYLAGIGNLLRRQIAEMVFHRLEMDHEEQCKIVEKGEERSWMLQITHVGHGEGGGFHDGLHDLVIGRGNGIYGSGKAGLISDAFHDRDGEGSDVVDIGGYRTGNGIEKRADEDGRFVGLPRDLFVSRRARFMKMVLMSVHSRKTPNMTKGGGSCRA